MIMTTWAAIGFGCWLNAIGRNLDPLIVRIEAEKPHWAIHAGTATFILFLWCFCYTAVWPVLIWRDVSRGLKEFWRG